MKIKINRLLVIRPITLYSRLVEHRDDKSVSAICSVGVPVLFYLYIDIEIYEFKKIFARRTEQLDARKNCIV